MNSWQMTQMVDSPGVVDDQRVDSFFQLVPPTPRNPQHQHLTHPIPLPPGGLVPGLARPLFHSPSPGPDSIHLGEETHYGLRSHRSSLSVGSIDSHISSSMSAFSGQWSNISSTDSVADSDDLQGQGQVHGSGHKRQVSLSIDPNLFRPKDKTPAPQPQPQASNAGSNVRESNAGEVDDGDVPTAVPKKAKKPAKKKGGGMTAEERKKVSHARKRQQQPDHIPRPRNAFILFRKHVVDSKLIPPSVEMRHQNVSIITAKMWSEAPAAQKAHFNELAKKEKEEHMRKYPGYRYQPVYRRTNVIRRRVRKDEAEEEKCRSVAELLLKGKSGDALEQEIKEKIKRGEHFAPTKKVKAPAEKTNSASELSKGAIRALRAQARQDSVSEWSDVGSRPASPEDMGDYATAQEGLSVGVGLDGQYGYTEGMGYVHPALGGWNFQRDNHPVPLDGFGEWQGGEYTDQAPGYAYPQPHGEFPYDNLAIPTFSPPQAQSQLLLSTPPQHHAAPTNQGLSQPQAQSHGLGDGASKSTDVFMPPPFPSPTGALYASDMPQGRLSARWDTTHFTLPPSHDAPFGNLGSIGTMGGINMGSMGMTMDDVGINFSQYASGGDMMLHDFGAALAQAEEMADGEWK